MCYTETHFHLLCSHYGRPQLAGELCVLGSSIPGWSRGCWNTTDLGVVSEKTYCPDCTKSDTVAEAETAVTETAETAADGGERTRRSGSASSRSTDRSLSSARSREWRPFAGISDEAWKALRAKSRSRSRVGGVAAGEEDEERKDRDYGEGWDW
ncbi:hypothetical protein LTR50_001590 [Elasticomyces elasticus]|nr:hypothetical protein LTR50_001590 [Elasticomyces elasticus]